MKSIEKALILFIIALGLGVFYLSTTLSKDVHTVDKEDEPMIYGETEISDYLSGKFSPASHSLFVSLEQASIPTDGRKHYLRIETVNALKKMLNDFSKDHPKIRIFVRSSTRTYNDQTNIWNGKWRSNSSIKDDRERALKILEYSSMPGTSRHHWGTDFDLNSLNNEYFLKGEGKIIYSWLKDNAHKYGFYQPYTAGRKTGYNEEKWHWSYMPLAYKFTKDWNANFLGDSVNKLKGFLGSDIALDMAELYVNSINPDCL